MEWEDGWTWYRVTGELRPSGPGPLVVVHGGPGASHDYLESLAELADVAGRPCVVYDQIGCGRSQHLPGAPEDFWTVELFRRELRTLSERLGIAARYHVLGQSWGGILAMEYALRYQVHLRGLVISNMMSSAPAYNAYAQQVLMPKMDGYEFVQRLRELPGAATTPVIFYTATYFEPEARALARPEAICDATRSTKPM